MAEAEAHHPEPGVPGPPQGVIASAHRILANPSDQEAVDLDTGRIPSFPQLSLVDTNQSASKLSRWWKRHVSLGVPHVKCRDHLGKDQDRSGNFPQGYFNHYSFTRALSVIFHC